MSAFKKHIKNNFKAVYKNLIFQLSAQNNPLFLGFYKKFYTPRKGSLAEFADYYSRNKETVTVVQVGANDGFNHDPIHKFIKRDKWQGVLLEPQKEVFEDYLQKLHHKNPAIHTVNAALDYKDGSRPIYKISFSNARWATGLTTFDRSTLEKAVESDYVKACAQNEGVQLPAKESERIKEEKIETISPETLIKKYKLKKIDWLQIDAEGFDYNIIKMFDIAKTQPEVIVFEQYQLSPKERQECYNHLKENQYQVKEYGRDALAIRQPTETYQQFL